MELLIPMGPSIELVTKSYRGDLDAPDHFYWVPLRDLIGRAPERRGKTRVVTIPTAEAFEVSYDRPFLDAHIAFAAHCGRVRQAGVISGVVPGRHDQAALGVI